VGQFILYSTYILFVPGKFDEKNPISVASTLNLRGIELRPASEVSLKTEFEKTLYRHYNRFNRREAKKTVLRPHLPTADVLRNLPKIQQFIKPLSNVVPVTISKPPKPKKSKVEKPVDSVKEIIDFVARNFVNADQQTFHAIDQPCAVKDSNDRIVNSEILHAEEVLIQDTEVSIIHET